MTKIKNKSKRGGARPGAGAPSRIENAQVKKVYISKVDVEAFTALGNGNFSLGIRHARTLLGANNLLRHTYPEVGS